MSKNFTGLLLAATAKEIAPFIEAYREAPSRFSNWDILISGPGLTASTYHLTRYISLKRPSLVIMAGIAGSFDDNLRVGTVVSVKEDIVADEGVFEKGEWKSLFHMGLLKKNQFPFSNGWLKNKAEILKATSLKKVRAITVNQVTTSAGHISAYQKAFKPSIESMEGASLHYVCLMENISFLQLRAISNKIGVRNKSKWNFKDSISNLNKELLQLVNTI